MHLSEAGTIFTVTYQGGLYPFIQTGAGEETCKFGGIESGGLLPVGVRHGNDSVVVVDVVSCVIGSDFGEKFGL